MLCRTLKEKQETKEKTAAWYEWNGLWIFQGKTLILQRGTFFPLEGGKDLFFSIW